MSKSRLAPQTDATGKRSRFPCSQQTAPGPRKSESDDSSDPLESPTLHCYVVGRRPKRTLPRRALSTGVVELDPATLSMHMDRLNLKIGNDGAPCAMYTTPPRSKSAVNFRRIDSNTGLKDPVLQVPNLGTRAIYTPTPPSLTKFYATNRMSSDSEMDIDTSSSLRSIAMSLDSVKLESPPLPPKGTWGRSMMAACRPHRQPSPSSMRRGSKYVSDEEMHIATTTEEEDSEMETQVVNRSMTSTRSFRANLNQQSQNFAGGSNPSWFTRIAPRSSSKRTSVLQSHILQPVNQNLSLPVVVISKCEAYPGLVRPNHYRRQRENLAIPASRC